MALQIIIRTIPHNQHRYETVGDYWAEDFEGTKREIRVSEMSDWRREFLVAMHEAIEQALCLHRGINEPDIKAFDEQFEARRAKGLEPDDAEPGDHAMAPYNKEHQFATLVERFLAKELGVDWDEYGKEVMAL